MNQIGTYYATWTDGLVALPEKHSLAKISAPITHVYLSFCKPDLTYVAGQNSFKDTGLNFSSSFLVVKNAIKILKSKGIIVMLSVGGASYWVDSTKIYKAQDCVNLMRELGCQGLDLDWEVGVNDSEKFVECLEKTKKLLFAEYLSWAGFSTGAHDPAAGDKYRGMNIPALKKAGGITDWVNIMAYDAGKCYDYRVAVRNYRKFYSGPLVLGYCIGKQGWGDARNTIEYIENSMSWMKRESLKNGIFTWYYSKDLGFEKVDSKFIHDRADKIW